jgi:hypothetical protein
MGGFFHILTLVAIQMTRTLIYSCEQIIRDIANYSANRIKGKSFRQAINQKLKFEKEDDWITLCSLIDVLGDTELAKENFLKYDLSGPTKIKDTGEQYLRLYGIVNAVYLQKSVILSFLELIKFHGKKQFVSKFSSLGIIKLRNIVGAHTVDFKDGDQLNPHQISRGSLEHGPISARDSKGKFTEYDLKKLLTEYNEFASDLLITAIEKFIKMAMGGQKLKEYNDRLGLVKGEQKGDIVIYPIGADPFIVTVIK